MADDDGTGPAAPAEPAADTPGFVGLPVDVVHAIFLYVRVDERLRCREVCRGWCTALEDRALWRTLNFAVVSPLTGGAVPHRPAPALTRAVASRSWPAQLSAGWQRLLKALSDALSDALVAGESVGVFSTNDVVMLAAAARADGGVEKVAVGDAVSYAVVHSIAMTNPGLTLLYGNDLVPNTSQCHRLLVAARQLHISAVDVRFGTVTWPGERNTAHPEEANVFANSAMMLRGAAPYDRVHLRSLLLHAPLDRPAASEEALTYFAESVAAYPEPGTLLLDLNLWFAKFGDHPRALLALADAALARGLRYLMLVGANLTATAVPALARLLGSMTLTHFRILNYEVGLFDDEQPAATQLLCDALRANSTLQWFELCACGLMRSPTAFASVLTALRGHPSIKRLSFSQNVLPDPLAPPPCIGDALGALVAANAPALKHLDLFACYLGVGPFQPIADALHLNEYLEINALTNMLTLPFLVAMAPVVGTRMRDGAPLKFYIDDREGVQNIIIWNMKECAHYDTTAEEATRAMTEAMMMAAMLQNLQFQF